MSAIPAESWYCTYYGTDIGIGIVALRIVGGTLDGNCALGRRRRVSASFAQAHSNHFFSFSLAPPASSPAPPVLPPLASVRALIRTYCTPRRVDIELAHLCSRVLSPFSYGVFVLGLCLACAWALGVGSRIGRLRGLVYSCIRRGAR